MSVIAERYRAVRDRISDAADLAGRDPGDVTIVAVTKSVGPAEVRDAIVAGLREFGENRSQEFIGKYGLFPDVAWHFIGTLQTNKVKDVVGKAALIHSIDSMHLLREVGRRAEQIECVQDVLLQVNVSSEGSKHGFAPDDVEDALRASLELPAMRVRGLMTMAPFGRPEDVRWVFRDLASLFARMNALRLNGIELTELSMGMTNDFEVAVEEGATLVRIGRAIFGR